MTADAGVCRFCGEAIVWAPRLGLWRIPDGSALCETGVPGLRLPHRPAEQKAVS